MRAENPVVLILKERSWELEKGVNESGGGALWLFKSDEITFGLPTFFFKDKNYSTGGGLSQVGLAQRDLWGPRPGGGPLAPPCSASFGVQCWKAEAGLLVAGEFQQGVGRSPLWMLAQNCLKMFSQYRYIYFYFLLCKKRAQRAFSFNSSIKSGCKMKIDDTMVNNSCCI